LIWQINKSDGFSGSDLKSRLWSDIDFAGRPIRNVCPIKAADQLLGTHCYFLSNRNFDVKNDSIFLLKITDQQDAPELALEIEVIKTDLSYGLAPNAQQKIGLLQTNDSRVLDGFVLGDQIQFVMNCVDTMRGRPSIYHGVLNGLGGNNTITGQVLTDGKDDLAYPGIAYTGIENGDQDAIIVFAHSSRIRNAGWSAVYYDNNKQYSEFTTIKEGRSFINLLDENLERWGDYIGIQRRYDSPGRIWGASTFGETGSRYGTWIAEIGRPGLDLTSVKYVAPNASLQIFPNPADDFVSISFNLPRQEEIDLALIDASGQLLRQFFQEKVKKSGTFEFSFSTVPLQGGIYFLRLQTKSGGVFSKRLVVIR
jgi:hypothetical protein